MAKPNIHRIQLFAIIISFLISPLQIQASHFLGCDITYQHVGGNQYLINLRIYNDCEGIFPASNYYVCYSSNATGYADSILLMSSGVPIELPPFPYIPPNVSSCNGGMGFGFRKYEYSGILSLPDTSDDWIVSYTVPPTIYLWLPPEYNFHVSTKIDNENYAVNSSVQFVSDPLILSCINQTNWNDFAATDPDGDSIVYSLVSTLIDSAICPSIPFPPQPFSIYSPPASSPPMSIDLLTGAVTFTPIILAVAHITVKATEFRNGVVINETIRTNVTKSVTSCISSSFQEIKKEDFILFPNPVSSSLNVQFHFETENPVFKFFNCTGNRIYLPTKKQHNSSEWYFDTGALKPGVYYVTVTCDNETYTKRFVKI